MLELSLGRPLERVLAIGCHADDLEIGCGGTMLSLLRAHSAATVTWVVLGAAGSRAEEARRSADRFLADAGDLDIRVCDYRDGFMPYLGGAIKEFFEELKPVEPQIIFTHTREDLHQDHRLACELTWNTFRNHLILEYEIPKYDGDLGWRNFYVPLTEDIVQTKLDLVCEGFPSQHKKHWFDEELLRSILRLRGVECTARYAEAFTSRKVNLILS